MKMEMKRWRHILFPIFEWFWCLNNFTCPCTYVQVLYYYCLGVSVARVIILEEYLNMYKLEYFSNTFKSTFTSKIFFFAKNVKCKSNFLSLLYANFEIHWKSTELVHVHYESVSFMHCKGAMILHWESETWSEVIGVAMYRSSSCTYIVYCFIKFLHFKKVLMIFSALPNSKYTDLCKILSDSMFNLFFFFALMHMSRSCIIAV